MPLNNAVMKNARSIFGEAKKVSRWVRITQSPEVLESHWQIQSRAAQRCCQLVSVVTTLPVVLQTDYRVPKGLHQSLPKPRGLYVLLPPEPITHLRAPSPALALWTQPQPEGCSENSSLLHILTKRAWAMLGLQWQSALVLANRAPSAEGSRQVQHQSKGSPESKQRGSIGKGGQMSNIWTESRIRSAGWRPAPRERKGINKGSPWGSWQVLSLLSLSQGNHSLLLPIPMASQWPSLYSSSHRGGAPISP